MYEKCIKIFKTCDNSRDGDQIYKTCNTVISIDKCFVKDIHVFNEL